MNLKLNLLTILVCRLTYSKLQTTLHLLQENEFKLGFVHSHVIPVLCAFYGGGMFAGICFVFVTFTKW